MRLPLFAALCAALLGSSPRLAAAQTPGGAGSAPPDIVRLKDGGMVRGTIIELVPNGSVKIQLADGQTRTFAMADTTYAGPASAEGRGAGGSGSWTAEGYARIHAQNAKLALQADQPNVTFHLETASAESGYGRAVRFSRLCTAPCSIEVPAGPQHFALSLPDSAPVLADDDLVVGGQQTVRGAIVNRKNIRLAGGLLLSIGLPLATGAVLLGSILSSNPQSQAPTPLFVSGGVVGALSVTFGVILLTRHDYVTLDVQPGVASPAALLTPTLREQGRFSPSGLTMAVRF